MESKNPRELLDREVERVTEHGHGRLNLAKAVEIVPGDPCSTAHYLLLRPNPDALNDDHRISSGDIVIVAQSHFFDQQLRFETCERDL